MALAEHGFSRPLGTRISAAAPSFSMQQSNNAPLGAVSIMIMPYSRATMLSQAQ